MANLAGASDSLSNMVKALNQLRLDTAENVARMIVIQIKSGSNSYDDIIGKEDVIKIKKAAESHCKYGLKMTLLPNQLERQALMEAAQTELRNNRDGKPGLTYPAYINIENTLNYNLKTGAHDLGLLGGFQIHERNTKLDSYWGQGFSEDVREFNYDLVS